MIENPPFEIKHKFLVPMLPDLQVMEALQMR